MSRATHTYRPARRNAWRRAKRIWREGSAVSDLGGIRYLSHASLPQVRRNSRPVSVPTARVPHGRLTGDVLRIARANNGVGRPPKQLATVK